MEPYLKKYPNLSFGATIAPWIDSQHRSGYFGTQAKASTKCRGSELQKANDFIPLLKELMYRSQYVWVYGASGAGYFPFTKEGQPLNEIIRNIKLQ